jgi:hypothetical protein
VRIEGTDLVVSVLAGDVATVLVHCVRRFYYEVDGNLRPEDVQGHIPTLPTNAPYETNHASGTAVAIQPRMYPSGVRDGFTTPQVATIRDILADCAGVVWWGGDGKPAKESHFQIDLRPGDPLLRTVATRITQWHGAPGKGAGVLPDPLQPDRRRTALDLASTQRR